MRENLSCPQCGSGSVYFSPKRACHVCEDCHQEFCQEPPAPLRGPVQEVFISYGRTDALDFTKRLADDLAKRGRHKVWFDLEGIEKGALFEVRIEQGIKKSTVVAAVMTRHSLREESVCRDEVVYALNEGKKLLPLRVDPDPQLKPTLLLARRNWIDFTENYEAGLDALLKYLAGDDSGLCQPQLPTVTGVDPLDFSVEIANLSQGFTGRSWLTAELDRWLGQDTKPTLVIVAEPGLGKSAIAAWLSQTRQEQVLGIHFCIDKNSRTKNPFEFVANLTAQLHARLPGFAEAVAAKKPEKRRATAADAFRELIIETTRSLNQPTGLIIVDSLDEAMTQEGETIVDVLEKQAPDLPPWLRLVATTRPEDPILRRIRTLNPLELPAARPENLQDLEEYIKARLARQPFADSLGSAAAQTANKVISLAAGNFLYAQLVLNDLEKGDLAATDLGRLAPGLAGFYSNAFSRGFPDKDDFAVSFAPLLQVLTAAQGQLSFPLLQRVTQLPAEELNRRLLQLRPYLRVSGTGEEAGYSLFHKSLPDWLTDREEAGEYWCQAQAGHSKLADSLKISWQDDDYALRYLPIHFLGAGRWEELVDTCLAHFPFLMAKSRAGLVEGILEDYRLAFAKLPQEWRKKLIYWEAFFRERAHILRRGTAAWPTYKILLQLAVEHADDSPLTKGAEDFLAAGRVTWPWLRREYRPEQAGIDPCLAVLEGHTGGIKAALVLADGRLLSWSEDKTLRLWDLEGKPLAVLAGHTDWVIGALGLPDGRILSWSSGSLRLWDRNGKPLDVLTGHLGINGAEVLPDGQLLVSDGNLWLRDQEGKPPAVLRGHTRTVWGALVLSDGRILSWSLDTTLRLWDREGKPLTILEGHTESVKGGLGLPDGRLLSWARDDTLRLWDPEGQPLAVLEEHTESVRGALGLPDGRILSWSGDKTLGLWDPEGKPIAVLAGHYDFVEGALWLPVGRILSWSRDKTLRLWDPERRPLAVLAGHTSKVWGAQVLRDGGILSWSLDKTLRLWDPEGKPIAVLAGHSDFIEEAQELPDGRFLSWSVDKTLRLWDRKGKPLAVLKGHTEIVRGALGLPDGRILSWAKNDTLRLWDQEGRPLAVLTGHKWISGAEVLPDGRILSWAEDNTLRLWDSDGRPLAVYEWKEGWRRYPEVANAVRRALDGPPNSVYRNAYVAAKDNSVILEGKQITAIVWHGASKCTARQLLPNGRALVTQDNGQVCVLQFYHGNRPISLDELEAMAPVATGIHENCNSA